MRSASPPDKDALFDAMERMHQKGKNELEEMGKKGRKYILKNYNWESKANELYNFLQMLVK